MRPEEVLLIDMFGMPSRFLGIAPGKISAGIVCDKWRRSRP